MGEAGGKAKVEAKGKARGRMRAGVVLREGCEVALIKRVNDRGTYYVFPGGGIEQGETAEAAATREAYEELGLRVKIEGLLATVIYKDSDQLYFLAHVVGGEFGRGTGEELSSPANSHRGTYEPVWIHMSDLRHLNARPPAIARLVMEHNLAVGEEALCFTEEE